jgi:predicted ArsR family transcriptional regulator
MADPLSDDVRRFIDAHISSVEQLEALILLKEDTSKELTAQEVAKALYTSEESSAARLADLHKQGLLSQVRADVTRYRYEPRSSDLRTGVEVTLDAYAKRKVAVINQIFVGPGDVQTFADAFKFRQEED